MHVTVFDCRDAPRPELAVATLRVASDDGLIVLQSVIYRDDPRRVAEAIAAGLGCEMTWVGPEFGRETTTPEPAEKPQDPGGMCESIVAAKPQQRALF
jgi:hypothetical protein